MFNRKNLFETGPGEILGYLSTLNDIGSSLNNNKHIEATLFMVAKALLCKIKLLFEKKTMGEKWPVSQQLPPTIPPLAPPLFMLRQRTGPPSIPETGVRGQRGPLDISYDNTPGCVMWGGGISIREREKNRANDESEMRSKGLAFRKDWKAQITRSACRSSVLKSIHTIFALGCQVRAAPHHAKNTPSDFIPYSVSLLHRSPFWLSIIKEGILTGSYRKMAATFGGEDTESVMGWRGVASHSAQHEASSLSIWNAAQAGSGTEPNMLVSALNWGLYMSLKRKTKEKKKKEEKHDRVGSPKLLWDFIVMQIVGLLMSQN